MKLLPVILLVGFVSIAVFGFAAMNDDHGSGCLATMVNGGVCPEQNPLVFAAFHLEVFKSFSSAVFSGNFAGLFSIILALALILATVVTGKISPPAKIFTAERKRYFESFLPLFRQAIIRWLALRENSPALA
ncbi:MAG: hypothetical protein Q8P76_04350 [bacterium]|nr:hypothetical protein [bacterium]